MKFVYLFKEQNRQNRNALSKQIMLRKSAQHIAMIFTVSALISACGGGGGDSTSGADPDSLIPGGPSGVDASEIADDELRRIAASRAGAGLSMNLDNLGRLSDQAQTNSEAGNLANNVISSGNSESLDSLENSNSNFLNNSLGIDDPGAMTTRVGNVITIDPDDQTICSDGVPLADGLNDDLTQCQQLATDLMVQIDALSEESGIITYLFQDTPVLLIGYSPTGANYELRLAGLQLVSRTASELDGVSEELPIMSGTLRLAATVLNSNAGSEAGELSLKVTEAIQIGTTGSDTGLTLQPSTVFELSIDEASGDVSMGLDWGALQLITASGDSDGNLSMTSLNLGGLSGELNFNEDQPTFQIRNIGLGNVPLNITIDSVESVNLSLANFGITVDSNTGMINLDGALNANLMLNNLAGLLEDQALDFTASASFGAPAGTNFVQQVNGSTLVSSGGPLTATLIGGDGMINGQTEVSVEVGECFSSADDVENPNPGTSAITEVPCN